MNDDLISRSALLEKCHDWMSTLELRQKLLKKNAHWLPALGEILSLLARGDH